MLMLTNAVKLLLELISAFSSIIILPDDMLFCAPR